MVESDECYRGSKVEAMLVPTSVSMLQELTELMCLELTPAVCNGTVMNCMLRRESSGFCRVNRSMSLPRAKLLPDGNFSVLPVLNDWNARTCGSK